MNGANDKCAKFIASFFQDIITLIWMVHRRKKRNDKESYCKYNAGVSDYVQTGPCCKKQYEKEDTVGN